MDGTQAGMDAGQIEGGGSQVPGAKLHEVLLPELREFLEQGAERAPDVARAVPEAVVRLEDGVRAPGQDDARPRDPIGLLAVDQVTDDVEGTECVGALHSAGPGSRKPVQQGVQDTRRSREDRRRKVEVKVHGGRLYVCRPSTAGRSPLIRSQKPIVNSKMKMGPP